MWQANKVGILTLLIGFAVLGGVYAYLHEDNPQLAKQIMACGVCVLLFAVALATLLSVYRDIRRQR